MRPVMTMEQIDQASRLLGEAADALTEAHWVRSAPERTEATRQGALRVVAAVLAVRGAGAAGSGRAVSGRVRSPWLMLAQAAPELREWAEHLARAEAHPPQDVRGVDDLLRAGEDFLMVAAATLGLPAPMLPATLVPVSAASAAGATSAASARTAS